MDKALPGERKRMFPIDREVCRRFTGLLVVLAVLVGGGAAAVYPGEGTTERPALTQLKTASRVSAAEVVPIKILAINDFHGQLGPGRKVHGRPVGSAPVLAAYLKAARRGWEDNSLIAHVGDLVGASPPNSAMLQDEPSIMFFNLLTGRPCHGKMDPDGDLAGTVGNHEFDEGVQELERLLNGGNSPEGPFLENPYRGAQYPIVSANVVWAQDGRPLFPPYVIKKVRGVPIAFIGAVLKATPTMVNSRGVAGLKFLDEADAINSYVPTLQAQHVRAIVVLLHQGGWQQHYAGSSRPGAEISGPVMDIVNRLDDEIDVVLSGHTHRFSNALVKNQHGKEILVTQAYAYSTAYADVTLEIDQKSDDIVSKSAAIVTTYADAGPGLKPDAAAAELVARADARVGPIVHQVIGTAAADISKVPNGAGESALGDLIADAQRAAMGTDFAFTNQGGIRADIGAGQVTWGELYTVQPFRNTLVKMELSGQQIYDLLAQQFPPHQGHARILQVSGLSYTWGSGRPDHDRIVEVRKNGKPIDRRASYTMTVNSFLAAGGDKFTVLTQGRNQVTGPVDLEALVAYVQKLPQPFMVEIDGRIRRGE
jgi:5'-nucleotidase